MNTNATPPETIPTENDAEESVRLKIRRGLDRAQEPMVLHTLHISPPLAVDVLARATPVQLLADADAAERGGMHELTIAATLHGEERVTRYELAEGKFRLAAMARALARMQTETDKALGDGTPDRDQWARYHVTFGELGWGYVADPTRERGVGAALAAYLSGQTDEDAE